MKSFPAPSLFDGLAFISWYLSFASLDFAWLACCSQKTGRRGKKDNEIPNSAFPALYSGTNDE
jgi:hypothetical protein